MTTRRTTTPDVLIKLDQVTAGHKGSPVVRNLDLTVAAGEVVALLGPNGAGKTTTLNTISGLLPLISGEAEVLGNRIDTLRPWTQARRGLVHVPDDRSIFFGLTVRENLRVGSRNAAEVIDRVVGYFPALGPLLGRLGGLLSGGEQQMLAVGRGIAQNPKVLMVDEMSLGLAPLVARSLMPVMRRVADEQGIGVLIVEQHVQLALEVADRAYVLSHGQLRYQGAAAELAENRDLLEECYLATVSV
jgi:branched-chain amino acid transport system ATP-binding protein